MILNLDSQFRPLSGASGSYATLYSSSSPNISKKGTDFAPPCKQFLPDFSFSQGHLILPVAEAKNLDYSFSLSLPSMHQEILQKHISQQLPLSLKVSAYNGLITPHCLYQPVSRRSHLTSFHPDRLGSLLFLEPSVRVLTSGSLHGTLPHISL